MNHLEVNVNDVSNDSLWVSGEAGCGKYVFYAKVYDEPGPYGIYQGRTSKLKVILHNEIDKVKYDIWDNCIAHYDRSWDIQPKESEHIEIVNAIVDELENIPEYEDRIYSDSKTYQILNTTKKKFKQIFSSNK